MELSPQDKNKFTLPDIIVETQKIDEDDSLTLTEKNEVKAKVQHDFQISIANLLNDFGEVSKDTLVADTFVIEGREHQNAADSFRNGIFTETSRIHDRTASRSRHHALGVDTGL